MNDSHPRIPVILGQTATGKTSIGIALANAMNGEIISVDSRKVYQGLPIGTATPKGERNNNTLMVKGIPHHLMSFLPPDQAYNAGDFAADADRIIKEIQSRGKTPILVGGTGFYFKALSQGLPALPKADDKLREQFDQRILKEGVASLRQELEQVDPTAAQAITDNDRHKIIRALEIFQLTGIPFSQWKDQPRKKSEFQFAVMGLQYPKDLLERRIEQRSQRMLEEGMIEETEAVIKKGFSPTCHALASFGYREAVEVIQGKKTRKEFLMDLIKGTKAYAKRQRTWFRTQISPAWFLCETPAGEADAEVEIAERMKAFCYTPPT